MKFTTSARPPTVYRTICRICCHAWAAQESIRRYRVETWGRDQWLKYCRGLVRAFEGIAANPDGGRDRNLFAPGLRSVNYRQHVIFFARVGAAGDTPVILRIVHQRRHTPALIYFEDLDG